MQHDGAVSHDYPAGLDRDLGIAEDEMVMGFPAEMLQELVDALQVVACAPEEVSPPGVKGEGGPTGICPYG